MTNTNQTGGPRRWQDDSEYKRLKRIEGALVRVIAATKSHIDGRDLLDELHPRRSIDIKVRVDSRERWHEGDWLSSLRSELRLATKALGPLPMSLDAMREAVANADAEGVAAPEPATPAGEVLQIPEGFTVWEGGECPVDPKTTVEVVERNGQRECSVAGVFGGGDPLNDQWRHSSWKCGMDIIAYRVVSQPAPDAEKPASEQDAAPLPECQTDAGSAPDAVQGAGSGKLEALLNGHPKPRVFCSMCGANPGQPHQGDCLRMDMDDVDPIYRGPYWNWARDDGGYPPIAPGDVQPEPAETPDPLHPEHDGTGYWPEHKIGEV